jgi:hypothetical protein
MSSGFTFGSNTSSASKESNVFLNPTKATPEKKQEDIDTLAKRYVIDFGLDSDDLDEIKENICETQVAWRAIVGANSQIDMKSEIESCCDDGPVCKLMEKVGATYCQKSHGKALREICSKSEYKLDENLFIDWYIRYLHTPDDDFDIEDNDLNNDSVLSKSGTMDQVQWLIAPSGTSEVGKTWKCASCKTAPSIMCKLCRDMTMKATPISLKPLPPLLGSNETGTMAVAEFEEAAFLDPDAALPGPGLTLPPRMASSRRVVAEEGGWSTAFFGDAEFLDPSAAMPGMNPFSVRANVDLNQM